MNNPDHHKPDAVLDFIEIRDSLRENGLDLLLRISNRKRMFAIVGLHDAGTVLFDGQGLQDVLDWLERT